MFVTRFCCPPSVPPVNCTGGRKIGGRQAGGDAQEEGLGVGEGQGVQVQGLEPFHKQVPGLFVFIGAVPHSAFIADLVATTPGGFILTGEDIFVEGKKAASWNLDRDPFLLESSVPGIFAAGDVRAGVVRRVASAVGQGSVAISMVHKYLESV